MYKVMSAVYLGVIIAVPPTVAALPMLLANSVATRMAAAASFPFLYLLLFLLTCGGLSMPYRSSVKSGKFLRRLDNPEYRGRRMYGLCWTSVYYSGLPYHIYLSVPILKRLMFRLFGYKGQMDFSIHPDSWIRDLPLLDFGEGSYVGNKCSLGTNISLPDGTILVDRIALGARSTVGHFAAIALGSVLEEDSELGIASLCGIGSKIGKGVHVSPGCHVGHGVLLKKDTTIGHRCFIGTGTTIGEGVSVPSGTRIPEKSTVTTQQDLAEFLSLEIGANQ